MADATDDIRQEITKGRQDIADTRAAIAENLAILEHRVEETVNGVKETFDLHSQVKQRPWLIFSGAILVGYALGRQGNGPGSSADPPGSTQGQEIKGKELSQVDRDHYTKLRDYQGKIVAAYGSPKAEIK